MRIPEITVEFVETAQGVQVVATQRVIKPGPSLGVGVRGFAPPIVEDRGQKYVVSGHWLAKFPGEREAMLKHAARSVISELVARNVAEGEVE